MTFGIGLETVLFHYDLGAEKYHERVNKLKRRNMELIEKNERLAEKNRKLTEKNEKANSKLRAVKESKSYRIGNLSRCRTENYERNSVIIGREWTR